MSQENKEEACQNIYYPKELWRTCKLATLPHLLFRPSTMTDGKFVNYKVLYSKEPGSPDLISLSKIEATKDSIFRNLH